VAGCRSSLDAVTENYRGLLVISQVNADYYTEPKSQVRYPLIKGSLSNTGPSELDVVEFTLRFKDSAQNVIYEEHAYPVYVSEFGAPETRESLKPGSKTRFAFKSPKCPPSWAAGAVDIEITKVVVGKT